MPANDTQTANTETENHPPPTVAEIQQGSSLQQQTPSVTIEQPTLKCGQQSPVPDLEGQLARFRVLTGEGDVQQLREFMLGVCAHRDSQTSG